ncbi:MAG: hypothetical protein WAO91_00280 [Candidatus Nitrosotenuis sp.]
MFEKYCPICGVEVKKETEIKRFGKYFCSQEHAQQYVSKRAEEEKRMSEERKRQPRSGSC